MIALFLCWLAPAHAGDLLLSGGLSATPNPVGTLVPAWRLGYATGRFAAWGTVTYASFDATFEEDVSGFYLAPRLGARLDLADRGPGQVAPYLALSATTRLFGLSVDNDDVVEDADLTVRFPFGIAGGGGLDAGVTEALSVSAELGLEAYTQGFDEEGYKYNATAWSTTGALFLNLWL